MTTHRFIIALVWLLPATALAHGPDAHPADPNLHVDAALKDCSVRFAPQLTQSAFRRFAREFGSVSAFQQASPPTTLGKWGFAVDLEQIYFSVEEKSPAWNDTFAHPDSYHELGTNQAFPKLRLRMGLTDRLDVGVFFTKQLQANYGWLGFEGKYGILKQHASMPISLAVRAAYTKTLFVSDMDMHALGFDVTAGHTLWNIVTAYAGLGNTIILARETTRAVDLDIEGPWVPHVSAGLEVRYWHVAIGAEAHLAVINTFQVQASAVF